jgi:hypothetical protein
MDVRERFNKKREKGKKMSNALGKYKKNGWGEVNGLDSKKIIYREKYICCEILSLYAVLLRFLCKKENIQNKKYLYKKQYRRQISIL